MKALIHGIVVFSSFCLLSCTEKQDKVSYYGLLDDTNRDLAVIVNPELFGSHLDMLDRVEEIACHDSIPTVRVNSEEEVKLIGLTNRCMDGIVCMLSDVLKIQDDLIMLGEPITLDSLSICMSEHYFNPKKRPYFSDSPLTASVSIVYDQNDLSNLDGLIERLIEEHAALDLDEPLKVHLDAVVPPPPSPSNEL